MEAIHMLLDKVHLEEISNLVNAFLKQYMLNNNLQNDSVLCRYIQVCIISSLCSCYEDLIKGSYISCNIEILLIINVCNITYF